MTRTTWTDKVNMAAIVLACLLTTSVAFAQQGDRETNRDNRQQGDQSQQQVELPQFLKELDLSNEQEQQIRQSLTQHNQKLQETWEQFHNQHARAIEMEAAWASAVRDTLSEDDQRRFDQQQMQDQEMNRNSPEQAATSGQARLRQQRERQKAESIEDREQQRSDRRQARAAQRQQNESQSNADSEDQNSNQSDDGNQQFGFVVITLASPERYTHGTRQSAEQKQQCSQACRQYKEELTNVWQKLHQLHGELVSIDRPH
ncbi:MAG: hypothetical protein R3B91_08150 [Planctomycetaceae bacterium]